VLDFAETSDLWAETQQSDQIVNGKELDREYVVHLAFPFHISQAMSELEFGIQDNTVKGLSWN
jgi:hypothetical protein